MYLKKRHISAGTLGSGIAFGLSALLLSTTLPAGADVYHAVAKGETLRTIAARYQTPIAVLRTANSLRKTSDDAELPSMLLRVPEDGDAPVPQSAPRETVVDGATNVGWGKVTSSTTYQIKSGDSWEGIAAQYSKAGYIVTADIIREENPGAALKVGEELTVPLHQIVYNAVAKTLPVSPVPAAEPSPARSTPSASGNTLGGAVVSPISQDPGAPPTRIAQRIVGVDQSSVAVSKAEPKNVRRGPSVLGSRGRSAAPDMGGVRVLDQDESAVVEPPKPQPRVIRPNAPVLGDPEPEPEAAPPKIARVAKIAKNGARIRRLPEADATTLYNTPNGTELAVTGSKGSWISILMSDRSTGWLPAHYVNFTGAKVDISAIKMRDPGSNVGRTVRSSTGGNLSRYASASPVIAEALKWLGTPYVWGGTSRRGVDCSGFVLNAYRSVGYSLPRVSRDQAKVGKPVDVNDLRAGDRLYFSASGRRIDHTGLYMGDGLFVHASGSGRRVMVSNLFDRGNWNIYVGARR